MRRKAQQGRDKVRRTFRHRWLKGGVGLAGLFVIGLMASGALGDGAPFSLSTSTGTTTSPAPAGAPVSYIVTFKDNVPDARQRADITAANGTPGDAISVLSMYSLTFPAGEDTADAQTLAANLDVADVEQDLS